MEPFAPSPAVPRPAVSAGSPFRGALCMVLSAFGFSLMTLSVKLLAGRVPTLEIVFVRGLLNTLLTLFLLRRERVAPWGNRRRALVLRGTFGVVALACYYAATARLPLAEVTVLHYTNPLFTALIAAIWLRERVGLRLAAGLFAGLAGVVAIAVPVAAGRAGALGRADLPGVGLALVSAVLAALAYVTVRDLRRSEHPLVVVFWFSLVMIPFSAGPALAGWVAPTRNEWGILLLVALAAQVGQVFLTRGLGALPAGRAMTVGYAQVAFAVLWGNVFFGAIPGPSTIAGIALIVLGALLGVRSSLCAPNPAGDRES